jgi:RHH-type proline utilization regulon transcriptional repressor/proline dehydrogenase/delta 1-pyrroline-5-carboxylate dehydrogenase
MVAFTGSSDVGRRIVESARHADAGRTFYKQVIAEMGGKNAIIVDDDADIDEAVQGTIASAFGYSGQKCTACSRVIVLADIYDDYLGKLVEAASGIKPAPAELPGTTVGPLVDAEAMEHARRLIEIGKKEARCALAGQEPERHRLSAGATPEAHRRDAGAASESTGGYFFPPVIFADVPPRSRIAQEEILAPVLCVHRAASFGQAIEIANDTPFALTGGLYSRSPSNIELAKRRLRVGNLYVNRKITASRVDRQPFGGFDMSGLGTKTGGPDYLQQFTIPRTISENTMRHGFAPPAGSGAAAPPPRASEAHVKV